jgi:hypothetical protein
MQEKEAALSSLSGLGVLFSICTRYLDPPALLAKGRLLCSHSILDCWTISELDPMFLLFEI